jgi:hypothetical protein
VRPALGRLRALPHASPWRERDEIRELWKEADKIAREHCTPEEIKRVKARRKARDA